MKSGTSSTYPHNPLFCLWEPGVFCQWLASNPFHTARDGLLGSVAMVQFGLVLQPDFSNLRLDLGFGSAICMNLRLNLSRTGLRGSVLVQQGCELVMTHPIPPYRCLAAFQNLSAQSLTLRHTVMPGHHHTSHNSALGN
jgi:hypothetical protein